MEPIRSSEQGGSPNPTPSNDAAIQNVVDNMIANTEAYLHLFQQNHPAVPSPASQSYAHIRSSSGSSTSSQRLVNREPARHPSFATNLSWSSSPEYRPVSMDDDAISPTSTLVQSESVHSGPAQSEHEQEEVVQPIQPVFNIANDLIRLSTPRLPPRLDTPPTLSSRYDTPVGIIERENGEHDLNQNDGGYQRASLQPGFVRPEFTAESNPTTAANLPPITDLNVDPHRPEVPLYEGGLAEASRRLDVFRASTHEYMTLTANVSNDSQGFGTVTHVRTASEGQSLLPQGVRRKPLAPEAKTLRFNHSFTNEVTFVFLICMAQVLTWAGFAQALVPARQLSLTFPRQDRTSGHLVWYTSAYTLGISSFILLGHRLGRVFGRKKIFVIGYVWFGLWSLLAGLSDYVKVSNGGISTAFFCLCRALQGIGPALLIPNGQALLQHAYPPGKRKGVAMALFDAATPLGFVLGSTMASLFAHFQWWSWAFYSLCAVCIALSAMSVLVLPPRTVIVHDLEGGLWRRLDIINVVVGIAGLVIFCAGWNQAPIVSFKDAEAYVLLVIGLLLIVMFVYLETRALHPLVPFKQMEAPAAVAIGCTAASWAAFGIWLWYLVQFIEVLRGWTPLRLSAGFVPLLFVGLITAAVYSQFMHKNTAPHCALVISSIAVLVSSILMATAPAKQLYWCNAFFSILIMPIGMVLSFPATVGVLSRSLPEGYQGLASGLTGTSAGYAIAISLGMAGVVEKDILNRGGTVLKGYRAGQYLGLGLGGLSLLLAVVLLLIGFLRRRNTSRQGV